MNKWKDREGFWPNGKKLKILGVKPNDGGCAYYRIITPLQKLQELYPNVVDVKIEQNPLNLNPETGEFGEPDLLHWADVVMVSNINNFGGPYTLRVIGLAKEFGKFVHFDTDDLLTNLYDEHRLKEVYEDKKLSEMTKHKYSNADLVTVTEKKFAARVEGFIGQGNLLIDIPNAIDYNLESWNVKRKKSKVIRIGWAGGIHHDPDVKEFAGIPHLVNQKVGRENVFWDFYGYPPNVKSDDWQVQVWNNYKAKLLSGFKGHKNWNIHYALPPTHYGAMYANMDIAIAPLQMNDFNDSKSRIKIAEAGRYGVPLVASDVGSYNLDIINGETGWLLDPGASKSAWVKALSNIIKDKKSIKEMGMRLKQKTDEIFDLNKIVHNRLDIYEEAFRFKNYEKN